VREYDKTGPDPAGTTKQREHVANKIAGKLSTKISTATKEAERIINEAHNETAQICREAARIIKRAKQKANQTVQNAELAALGLKTHVQQEANKSATLHHEEQQPHKQFIEKHLHRSATQHKQLLEKFAHESATLHHKQQHNKELTAKHLNKTSDLPSNHPSNHPDIRTSLVLHCLQI